MIKVIIHGCNGHMGRVLTGLIEADPGMETAAGIDIAENPSLPYPVFRDPAACDVPADAVIDFSTAKAVDALLDACVAKKLPLVLCTTGLTDAQLEKVREAAKSIPILRSANMSLGINLLMKLIRTAAATLAPAGFDMEIVEKHHHRKLDAPSGTALALADSINEEMDGTYHYVYDRSTRHEARDPKEIGISAVRGGSIVGEHDVIYAGEDEVIEIRHTAYSRAIFAKGAIEAARFLAGKPAGLYTMSDVVG